jgi:Arc/MetJ family transcription regulator
MAMVTIEIDDDALAAAAEALGTRDVEETVNRALRTTDDRLRRVDAMAELERMAGSGAFDFDLYEVRTAIDDLITSRVALRHAERAAGEETE